MDCATHGRHLIREFEATPEQEAEMADQMLELSKCLAEEGIEMGDMSGASFELPADIPFEDVEAAMAKCQPDSEFSDSTGS